MKFGFKSTTRAESFGLGKFPSQSETPIAVSEQYSSPKGQEQVCQWGIGRKTTFILSSSYILALALAITHAVVFRYLDEKFEDDSNIPSQSHVTAASTIMANVVGFLIRICLAAAFTQYFWRLVRITPMRLETLEYLYTMRGSPISFFSLTALRKGWMLAVITIILWAVPIAMSFPSSAMTVRSAIYTHAPSQMDVPGMNAQETWGGNTTKMRYDNLAFFVSNNYEDADEPGYVEVIHSSPLAYGLLDTNTRPVIRQLATETVVNAAPRTMSSPCGVNCSYEIVFDGPHLSCNYTGYPGTIEAFNQNVSYAKMEIFSANWTTTPGKGLNSLLRDYQFKNVEVSDFARDNSSNKLVLEYNTYVGNCRPGRAEYHVVQEFRNGQQSSTVTTRNPQDLVSLDDPIYFSKDNITSTTLDQIRDHTLMTLIMAMSSVLTGSVESLVMGLKTRNVPMAQEAVMLPSGVKGNILAMSTPLFSEYSNAWASGDDKAYYALFYVDENILNSMLVNITLSAISEFQLSTVAANMTRYESRTQFVFSRPINLLLPYFLSLGVALPLAAMGFWSLRQNGVPATDSSFMQVAMTTRGNPELDQLALGGCLGGNHNESAQLKSYEVQFGELSRSSQKQDDALTSSSDLRVAGFAPQDEVTPLLVGKRYGVVYDEKE